MSWRSLALAAFLSPIPALAVEAPEAPISQPGGSEFVPDPEIEAMIERTADTDPAIVEKAIVRIAATGAAGERALQWHLVRAKKPSERLRWSELIARCAKGRVGYRITMELQPAGTGALELWSDRALLAECARKQDRLMGRPETPFTEEALRFNPYSKGELLKYIGEGMKFQEARVEGRGKSIEAVGVCTFQNFDALSKFAGSFDPGGYQMLAGISLTDSEDGTRTLRFKKDPEKNKQQSQNFLQLFHDVKWEFILDFRGHVTKHNAHRTAGSKLIWSYSVYQMVTGDAQLEVTYSAAGLPPRAAQEKPVDNTAVLPPVAQANQPIAVPKQKQIRARTSKREVNDRSTVINLDGSSSMPRVANLQYQWTQVSGLDLGLPATALSKPAVGLKIYEPGEYRFELVVTLDGQVSKPALVQVFVDDTGAPVAKTTATETPPNLASKTTTPIPTKALESDVGMLGMPAEKKTDTKKVYLDELKLKYGSIERFNQVWDTRHKSWDEVAGKSASQDKEKDPVVAVQKPTPPAPNPPPVSPKQPGNELASPGPNPGTKPQPKPGFWQDPQELAAKEPRKETPPPPTQRRTPEPTPEPVVKKVDPPVEPKRTTPPPTPEVAAPKPPPPTPPTPVEPKKAPAVAQTEVKPTPTAPPPGKEPKDFSAGFEIKPLSSTEPKPVTAKVASTEPKPVEPKPVEPKATEPKPVEPKKEIATAPPPEPVKEPKNETPATPATGGSSDGIAMLKAGRYAEAKPILEAAAAAAPNSQEAIYYHAVSLIETGEFQPAASKFEAASKIKGPLSASALMYVGHCYSRMNKAAEAGKWYKLGFNANNKLFWEISWQHGNKKLAAKDYSGAMEKFVTAEEEAATAGIKDYRLLRDMAIALHNNGDSREAAKRLKAMQELGYSPDPELIAAVRKAGGAISESKGSAVAAPGNTETKNTAPAPSGVKPPDAVASGESKAATQTSAPGGAKVEAPVNGAGEGSRETRRAIKEKEKAKPPAPKRPLPPIPSDFNAAFSGGKKAFEDGVGMLAEKTDESKANAAHQWDVAEAMFRSAWAQKPGDEEIITAFRELSKHSGPIALVPNPVLKSKVKGLVVLDASASIVSGKDKKMFCAWTQVEGEDIGLRPEEMAQPQVGLKIRRPGVYKFELAVSDGSRGGNPVTVTVEVSE